MGRQWRTGFGGAGSATRDGGRPPGGSLTASNYVSPVQETKSRAVSPERILLAAVLDEVIGTLARMPPESEPYREARDWVCSRREGMVPWFTFESLCSYLNLEAHVIRKGILERHPAAVGRLRMVTGVSTSVTPRTTRHTYDPRPHRKRTP